MGKTDHILDLREPTFQWKETDNSQGFSSSAVNKITGEALNIHVYQRLGPNPNEPNQILWESGMGISSFNGFPGDSNMHQSWEPPWPTNKLAFLGDACYDENEARECRRWLEWRCRENVSGQWPGRRPKWYKGGSPEKIWENVVRNQPPAKLLRLLFLLLLLLLLLLFPFPLPPPPSSSSLLSTY